MSQPQTNLKVSSLYTIIVNPFHSLCGTGTEKKIRTIQFKLNKQTALIKSLNKQIVFMNGAEDETDMIEQ